MTYEIIAIGYEDWMSPEEAHELVQSVNTEKVKKNERLSDSAYIFERATGQVRIA